MLKNANLGSRFSLSYSVHTPAVFFQQQAVFHFFLRAPIEFLSLVAQIEVHSSAKVLFSIRRLRVNILKTTYILVPDISASAGVNCIPHSHVHLL